MIKNNQTKKASTKTDAYELITNKFISAIESGTNPFAKPWNAGVGLPRNISQRSYRGINLFLTMFACQERNWNIPIFLTYKQAKEKGWQVKKGEKGTHVYFAGIKVPAKYKDNPNDCPKQLKYHYRKLYTVFNVAQIDGVDLTGYLPKSREFSAIDAGEKVVNGFTDKPAIEHFGSEAFYSPTADSVTMPPREYFNSDESYYSVLYHELAHSTGHASRLDRDMSSDKGKYAFEELIAEVTSGFLCAHSSIEESNFDRSAAYLATWLKCLKSDKKFLLQAASKAQLATDYILGVDL